MYPSSFGSAFGKLLLRLTVGGLLLLHGIHKVLYPETLGFIAKNLEGSGLPGYLAYGVYAGEVLAPVLLILGILTRFGGFLVVVNMIFAVVLAHAGQWLTLTQHGGWSLELQAFYLLGGLAILAMGSGRFALRPD